MDSESYTLMDFGRAFDLKHKEVTELIEEGHIRVIGTNGKKAIPIEEVDRWVILDEGKTLPDFSFRNIWCPSYDACLSAHADTEDGEQTDFTCSGCPFRYDHSERQRYFDSLPKDHEAEEMTLHADFSTLMGLWWE